MSETPDPQEAVSTGDRPADTLGVSRAEGLFDLAQQGPMAGRLFVGTSGYEVGGEIAAGGMGAVFSARQSAIRREVAFKVLLPASADDSRARFVEEAQITGQLEHPNIVPVHELATDADGQPYYTMKLVRGRTVAEILDQLGRGDMTALASYPLSALLIIFQKVCDALAFAHSRGVIHRDLKPANLMVGDYGEVLVMDWGLAKVLGGVTAETKPEAPREATLSTVKTDRRDSDALFTMDGMVMGTPHYMAPEQARGEVETLDPRADIYALGAILYHLLALRPPVSGGDPHELIRRVACGEVDDLYRVGSAGRKDALTERTLHLPGRRIPNSLAAVVRTAMALRREDRYASVAELQAEIAAYQAGFATRAEHAGPWKQFTLFVCRNRAVSTAVAAALVALAAVSAGFTVRVVRERDRAAAGEVRALAERNRAEGTLAELKDTAPTFAEQARSLIEAKDLPAALKKIEYAIALAPEEADYHALEGNILQSLFRFAEARDAYREALRFRSDLPFGQENVALCDELLRVTVAGKEPDNSSRAKLAAAMRRQGRAAEAVTLASQVANDHRALYDAWKLIFDRHGFPVVNLQIDEDGFFTVDLHGLQNGRQVTDISMLRGMPIKSLDLGLSLVTDLRPLAGMPLRVLNLDKTPVTDLAPLHGLPLVDLDLRETKVTDLAPLQGLPLERLNLYGVRGVRDLTPLAGMPLSELDCYLAVEIADISPLKGMKLGRLVLQGTKVANISVVRGMPLTRLSLGGTPIRDFESLRGMLLESFQAQASPFFSDLSLLRGMPLKDLSLSDCRVATLELLRGMKLQKLDIRGLVITDLSPVADQPIERLALTAMPSDPELLRVFPLKELMFRDTPLADLSVLKGLPLTRLELIGVPVEDLTPLRGMPLRTLMLYNTKVRDVEILLELPTIERVVAPADAAHFEVLRRLPRLREIGTSTVLFPAKDFWKAYDAQKAAK
jgi:serine/threonine protein kinase